MKKIIYPHQLEIEKYSFSKIRERKLNIVCLEDIQKYYTIYNKLLYFRKLLDFKDQNTISEYKYKYFCSALNKSESIDVYKTNSIAGSKMYGYEWYFTGLI